MNMLIILTLELNNSALALTNVAWEHLQQEKNHHICCSPAILDSDTIQPVPEGLLGYWVDVLNSQKHVIYRQYLNSKIPLNIAFVSQEWSGLKKRRAIYDIKIPELYDATEAIVYEQCRRTPTQQLNRRELVKASLGEIRQRQYNEQKTA